MAVKRVLVTRPEPGASATARRLVELGFEPVVMPLTETRPLDTPEHADFSEFDAVLATSGAALRHAPKDMLGGVLHLPLFAPGERSAAEASRAGFVRAGSAGGDAAAMAAQVARSLPKGSRLLYLCGRVRTGALAERLRQAGYDVTALETYDTVPVEWSPEAVEAHLAGRPPDAALIYSANAAVLLARLIASPKLTRLLQHTRLLCISARTADALPPLSQARAEIAQSPDEDALLRLLGAAE